MSVEPAELSALHATAFDSPWDEAAFAGLLVQVGVTAVVEAGGFILMRTVAGEGEVLTLAVRPEARRHGLGADLVRRGVASAAELGADRVFLEVADDNVAALALYARCGFEQVGRRPRYYARPDGSAQDALLLALDLPQPLPSDGALA